MKIVLAAIPIIGHVNPILSVAKILADGGHEIIVTTSRAFTDRVEAAGLPFHPLEGTADMDTRDRHALFPERRLIPAGPPRMLFDMKNIYFVPLPDQFATLKKILRDFPADLIIADIIFTGILPFLLHAVSDRPRIAILGTTVLPFFRDDGAPFGPGIPPANTPEELEQCRKAAATSSEQLFTPAQMILNALLHQVGAQPVDRWLESMVTLPDVFLQPSVPGFEYPRRNLPKNVKFIGCLPPSTTKPLTEDVQQQLEIASAQNRKIVLVTQGTVTNDDFGQLLLPTLQTFAEDAAFFVVATTGGRSLASMGQEFPTNSVVREYLPLDRVFPFVDVLITNGGYGTVSQALAAGIPTVVAGVTEEKAEVASHVAWYGAGLNLYTSTPSPQMIRDAVQTIVLDKRFAARASGLADEYARYDTPREIEQALAALFPTVR